MSRSSRHGARRGTNPTVGYAEDMFAPVGTLTPVVKALDEMTEAEIVKLPISAFSETEWDSLDEDLQVAIREGDPTAQLRIKALVYEFVSRHKAIEEPDERYLQDMLENDFDSWFQEASDDYVDFIRRRGQGRRSLEDLEAGFKEAGYSIEQIHEALNAALEDRDNWDFEYGTDKYRSGVFRASTSDTFYIEGGELEDLLEGMTANEIEAAIEEINNETYLHLKMKDLTRTYQGVDGKTHKSDFEVQDYVTYYGIADPDWDKIEQAADERLSGEEPEGEDEAAIAEDRIIYRFANGYYVVNLLASELPAEGRGRDICVGSSQYGYGKAIEEGRTQIWSLRDTDGKRLFTIEVRMQPDGSIGYINQIRAAHNAIPNTVREVNMAIELFKAMGIKWKHIKDIKDLKPGIRELKNLPDSNPEWDDDELDGLDDYCSHCGGPAVGFCRPAE